jgi:predicted RNA methylase
VGDTFRHFTDYDIQACLHDRERAELFRRAIFDVVKAGDVVVDAGSGSGLLGLFAAQAGAARVYCLEINEEYTHVIRENARRNRMRAVKAIRADATTYQLPEQVDVIISEVISAGFFYEPQLQIVNHLRQFLKPNGSIVPQGMENTVELINAQEELYGLTFTYDSRYHTLDGDHPLTDQVSYLLTGFAEQQPTRIEETVRLRGAHNGLANAVRINYRVEFTEGNWARTPTDFLMNPQIIFLPEPVPVEAGRDYSVSLAYEASKSPMTAKVLVAEATTGAEPRPAPAIASTFAGPLADDELAKLGNGRARRMAPAATGAHRSRTAR